MEINRNVFRFDPATIPGYRKGIIGYWPMDTISSGQTPDTSRQGAHPGKVVGGTINTSGGKFKGGLSLNANGYMLLSAPGRLPNDYNYVFAENPSPRFDVNLTLFDRSSDWNFCSPVWLHLWSLGQTYSYFWFSDTLGTAIYSTRSIDDFNISHVLTAQLD